MRFKELREKYSSKGEVVFNKKINRVPVKIEMLGPKEFCVYVEGEKLDTYKTQKEAESSAQAFIKELKQ